MSLDKLHTQPSAGTLQQRLSHTTAELSGNCLSYDSSGGLDPQVTLSLVADDDNYISVKAAFNRPPQELVTGDFTVTGPVSVDSLTGEGQVFILRLLKTGFGVVSVSLQANAVQDADDNYFPAAGPITVTLAARPIPVITGPSQLSIGSTQVSVAFNESVTGLSIAEFSVSGASVDTLQGSGNAYTLNIVVSSIDATPQLILPSGACQNTNGQGNVDSNLYSPIVSKGPLVATIQPTKAVFNTFTVNFLVRWNANVDSAFVTAYLSLTGATLVSMTKLKADEFLVSALADADGTVTLDIAADQFSIVGYDENDAATGSCEVDTEDLVFTMTPPTGWSNGLITIPVVGNLPNTGLTASLFGVVNGYATQWVENGNGGSLTVSPILGGTDVEIQVRIPGGVARSLSGMENAPAGPVSVYHDSKIPILTFTGFQRAGSEYVFSLTASEVVVKVLTYSHPESSSTVITGSGKSWQIRLTPIAEKGTLQITLPAGLFVDKAYNPTAETTSDSYEFDRVGPVAIWELYDDGHPISRVTNKSLRDFQLTFDSRITTTGLINRIQPSGGLVILTVIELNPGLVYRVATENNATVTQSFLRLPADSVQDAYGNLNEQAAEIAWAFDSVRPSVTSWEVTGNNANKTWTIRFTENIVPNLLADRVIVQGVTVTEVSYGPAEVVIMTITTTANRGDGVIIGIALPDSFVLDVADNGSIATEYFTDTVDTKGPVPTVTSSQFPQTVARFVTFIIEFDEPLENELLLTHLQLDNALLDPVGVPGTSFQATVVNRVYEAVIKSIEDGPVILRVPAGVVRDFDGNYNLEASLSVLVGSKFTPTLAFRTSDRDDKRKLVLSAPIQLDPASVSVDDFELSQGAFSLTTTNLFNEFDLLLSSSSSSATIRLPELSIQSTTQQDNNEATASLDYSIVGPAAVMSSTTLAVAPQVSFKVKIVWNTAVSQFVASDLSIGIRTDDQQAVAGTTFDGEVLDLRTLVPNYEYEATCLMRVPPENFQLKVHVWYDRSTDGAVDILGNPVISNAFISLPLVSPIVPRFSSPQFPAAEERLITVLVVFSGDLSRDLELADFELLNCEIAESVTGTSFTVSSDGRTYTLVVSAIVADDVTVVLPSGVATGEGGESVAGGEITIAWLGLSRYLLELEAQVSDRPDQLIVVASVPADVTLDFSQVTVGTFLFSENSILMEKVADRMFEVTKRPSIRQISIEASPDQYVSLDGRRNSRAKLDYVTPVFLPKLTIIIQNTLLSASEPLEFIVSSSTKLSALDPNDLVFGLRDQLLSPVSGFSQDGALNSFDEVIEGYQWQGSFSLAQRITTQQYRFYIYYDNQSGQTNLFGDLLPSGDNASIQVAPLLTTSVTQRTFDPRQTVIEFRVLFATDLRTSFVRDYLMISNGNLDTASPGQGFVQVSSRDYRVYVKPLVTGSVTVTVPEDVVQDISGQFNLEGSITVDWFEWFTPSGITEPTDKLDQFKLTLTLPDDVDPPNGVDPLTLFTANEWVVAITHTTDTFEWTLHTYDGLGPNFNPPPGNQKVRVSLREDVLESDDGAKNLGLVFPEFSVVGEPSFQLTISDNNIEIGDTFTVVVESNCRITPNNPSSLLLFAGFTEKVTTGINESRFKSSINGVNLSGSPSWSATTEVETGYKYSWEFTLDELQGSRDQLNQVYEYTYQGQPYSYDSHEVFFARLRGVVPSPGIVIHVVDPFLLRSGNPLGDLTDRIKLPLSASRSLVTFDWTANSESSPSRTAIFRVEETIVPSAGDSVLLVDWGDSSTSQYTAGQATVIGDGYRDFHVSHNYANANQYTVNAESLLDTSRITAVHEAKIRLNGTTRIVRANEAVSNRITRVTQNVGRAEFQDLKSVSISGNTNGILSVLGSAGANNIVNSLINYTGHYSAVNDSVINNPGSVVIPFQYGRLQNYEIYSTSSLGDTLGFADPLIVDLRNKVHTRSLGKLVYTTNASHGSTLESPVNIYLQGLPNGLVLEGPVHWRIHPVTRREFDGPVNYTVRDAASVYLADVRQCSAFDPNCNRTRTNSYLIERVTNCELVVDWLKNVRTVHGSAQGLPITSVQILEHTMPYSQERQFYGRLATFLGSLVLQQPITYYLLTGVTCDVVTSRVGGINPSNAQEEQDNAGTIQALADIQFYLSTLNRADAFQIIRE